VCVCVCECVCVCVCVSVSVCCVICIIDYMCFTLQTREVNLFNIILFD